MKLKNIFIPSLCFVIAVIILYGRLFILYDVSSFSPINPLPQDSSANIITVHYHERPPYYSTGPLGVYGLCSDPAKIAFKKAGIEVRWEKTPASRQLDILKANRSRDCLIGWFKNSDREKFAKYSHFIYQDKPTIALSRADNYQIISNGSLDETFLNDKLTLLKKNGYSYGEFIDKKISELNPNQLMTDAENIGMLEMIQSGRADYFFISEEEAKDLTASSGLLKTDFKIIRFTNIPEGNKRYLLFSKRVEDEVIEKINNAIKSCVNNES